MKQDGFEAAAIRRRIWDGLWKSSLAMTCTYQDAPISLEWDRAQSEAINAHSRYVHAGLLLGMGKPARARKQLEIGDRGMSEADRVLVVSMRGVR